MSDDFSYMKPCAIGKAQLSEAMGFANATNLFRKIHKNAQLMNNLHNSGYSKNTKLLTPRQMELICEVFGYPTITEK